MRLSSFAESDFRLSELMPPAASPSATPAPAPGTTNLAPGQTVQQDPNAQAKMLAQQALDRQNNKKQLQDQIKQTQDQIVELQKQLADQQKQLATLK